MNIRSIIIDDEPNNIENLQSLIDKYCPQVDVVATAYNAAEGITAIQNLKPNLIFLDIQMPMASGFDLLSAFTTIEFEVIFITAYDQYGIQAIKFSALDYLLKPINLDEFKVAIQRATEKIAARRQNQNIENLLAYVKSGQTVAPKIALPTLNETMYIKVNEIVRCEASGNYTTFCLERGETILVCRTLKEFADLLVLHEFVRTHQSHLVNLNYVKSYLKEDGGTLLLNDQTKIPISRQNRDAVRELLHNRFIVL